MALFQRKQSPITHHHHQHHYHLHHIIITLTLTTIISSPSTPSPPSSHHPLHQHLVLLSPGGGSIVSARQATQCPKVADQALMQATFPLSYGARLVAIEACSSSSDDQEGYINANGKRALSSVTRQFIAEGLNHNHSHSHNSNHSTNRGQSLHPQPSEPVKLGLAFIGRQSPGGHDVLAGNNTSSQCR